MSVNYEALHDQLSHISGLKLNIILNENHSTMLSVLDRKKDSARISLHRMFLEAPEEVLTAVADFIRGKQQKRKNTTRSTIQDYIQTNLKKFDYSHRINDRVLISKGYAYDLKKIYQMLNDKYFNEQLDLSITWFGKRSKCTTSRITFGQYHEPLKLIKINRMLDNKRFPDYFVSFVVYHEMLHDVHPPYIDSSGINRIHSEEFKLQEQRFEFFAKAKHWENKHRFSFFK